jgi:hypothetical protein
MLVIAENSTLTCTHTGKIQLQASQSKLTIQGKKVLVEGDLPSKPISGCTTVNDTTKGNKICLQVASATGGVAKKLKVNGKGVLLATIKGQTDGTVGGVPQQWSVQNANQTKLQSA